MTKDEIIDYVLNSPENTNPNILKGMLDQLDNGGSDSGGFEFVTIDFNSNTSDTFYFEVNNSFIINIPEEGSTEYFTSYSFELTFDSTHQTVQLNIPIIHSEEVTNILSISYGKQELTLTNIITSGGVIKDSETQSVVYFILNGPGSISFSVSSDDNDSGNDDGGK